MCVIYATGVPRDFAFAKAEGGQKTPEGAVVFAECDGKRIEQQLDTYTFDAMSDEEYYELQRLLGEVRRCEFLGHGCPYRLGILNRLWRATHSN